MKLFFQTLAILVLIMAFSCKRVNHNNLPDTTDTIIKVNNAAATVTFSKWGGALVSFRLNSDTVNPFTWRLNNADMPKNNKNGAPFQGHFLCTGRWGSPTPGEILSGIPHNGEPANTWWRIKEKSNRFFLMDCIAKLEGFEVKRIVNLAPEAPVVEVTEVFRNTLNIARNLPVVQHATIAAPFLDTLVVLQSNATKGFNQKFVPRKYIAYESNWPFLKIDTLGNEIDLRKSDYQEGYVGSYIFSDSIGWVTVYNPQYRLLLGYAWKTKDYPWMHIWHGTKDGIPVAKGLEFGTTGLGDTSPLESRFLLNFYGNTNYNFVDANASVEKKYICFLFKSGGDIEEIKSVSFTAKRLSVKLITQNKEHIEIFNLN